MTADLIQQPYTLSELRAKIASHEYSAELLLQHAMLLLDRQAPAEGDATRRGLLPCPFCGRRPVLTVRPDNAEATSYFAAVACFCGGYAACAHKDATASEADEAERLAREKWNGRAAHPQPKGTELPEADIRAGFRAAEDAWTFKGMTAWQVWLKACRWFESRVAQAPAPAPATEPFAKVGHHEFVAARNEWKATVWTTTELPTGTPLYAGPSPAVTHSKAAQDVLAERQRQISVEGWTPEHDDEHGSGCMAFAAAAYAAHAYAGQRLSTTLWNWTGWSRDWWKPKNPRADLIRAGALILAEIERLDRAPKPPVQPMGDGNA